MKKLTDKRKSLASIAIGSRSGKVEFPMEAPPLTTPSRRNSAFQFPPNRKASTNQYGGRRLSLSQLVHGLKSSSSHEHISSLGLTGEEDCNARDDFLSLTSDSDSSPCLSPLPIQQRKVSALSEDSKPFSTSKGNKWSGNQCMGRAMRVVVVGTRRVGKTSILRQVACLEDITTKPYEPTIEDTYQVLLEETDRPREILVFHDTAGIADSGPVELKRSYLQVADAYVLVFSVADHESFNRVDLLKKYIERSFGKEKKEVPIVVLANMRDLPGRKVDSEFAHVWAARERVKLFEVTAKDRSSLVDFVHYLGQRHFHPIKESKFSLSKKLKSDKSNAAILMDF